MKNLTEGKPLKLLLVFSLPLFFSMIFQQLYNMVDTIIAGRYISSYALAAVGASYPITILFIAVATGVSVGCSVIVAQLFGRQDFPAVKTAIYTSIISISVIALLLTLLGQALCVPLLRLADTPANIFADSVIYLRIYLWGIPFLFCYNAATALFNSLGDSRTTLYFLIFSSLLNIILDLYFVRSLGMGVAGVAWATFIAQGLSSLLAMGTLLRRIIKIPVKSRVKRFSWRMLPMMAGVALPSVFQQSCVSIGIFAVQGLINSFGDNTIAAFAAALKVSTFALMTMNTLSNALSSFASQNIGAGKMDRVYEGAKVCISIACGIAIAANLVFFFAGNQILGLFVTDKNADEITRIGLNFLHIVAPFYVLLAVKNSLDNVLRGGGAMKEFMITTFSDLLLRVILSFLLTPFLGFRAICWAYPIGWILGSGLSVLFFKGGAWQKNRGM